MEHFVVINDWSNEFECDVTILGVTHSLKEAKKFFNEVIGDEKSYAQEHGYEIYDDYETVFDAGKAGNYAREHTRVYIQKVTT